MTPLDTPSSSKRVKADASASDESDTGDLVLFIFFKKFLTIKMIK